MAQLDPQDTPFFNDVNPETCMRAYDETIKEWLLTLRYRDQTPHVTTGWMSRAFSQKKDLHGDTTQRTAQLFPAISFSLGGDIIPDRERQNTNSFYALGSGPASAENRSYYPVPGKEGSTKEDKEAILVFPWPLPFTFPYQIDIWTKTRQDWRFLNAAIMARFPVANEMYLKVDIPFYGEQLTRVTLDSISDTSDLETDEQERVLRSTISLSLHGWLYRVPMVKKTVTNAHVVVLGAEADESIAPGSPFDDWYCSIDHYNFNSDGSRLLSVDEDPNFSPPDRTLFWVSFEDGEQVDTGP